MTLATLTLVALAFLPGDAHDEAKVHADAANDLWLIANGCDEQGDDLEQDRMFVLALHSRGLGEKPDVTVKGLRASLTVWLKEMT